MLIDILLNVIVKVIPRPAGGKSVRGISSGAAAGTDTCSVKAPVEVVSWSAEMEPDAMSGVGPRRKPAPPSRSGSCSRGSKMGKSSSGLVWPSTILESKSFSWSPSSCSSEDSPRDQEGSLADNSSRLAARPIASRSCSVNSVLR